MMQHRLTRTISLGCILLAFAGLARAEIVQCINEAGAITYTDVPCKDGVSVVQATALNSPAADTINFTSRTGNYAAAERARELAWANKRANKSSLGVDVATLKVARTSMLVADQLAPLVREQKLAVLDLKDQHWFKF